MIITQIGRALALSLTILGALSAVPRAAEAGWLKAESTLFTVYSDGKEDELKKFVGELHEYDALMRTFTGTKAAPAPNKLSIYLVKPSQLNDAIPKAPNSIAGLYVSSVHGTQAVALRQEVGGLPARAIIMHEYAHHFMMQYHPAFYPTWYVEGFAEYFGSTEFEDDVFNIGAATPGRAWVLQNRPWVPIKNIIAPADPTSLPNQFYEESWLTVNWFMSTPELRKQMPVFLKALSRGEEPEKALTAATGLDFNGLDAALKSYLKKRQLPGFKMTRTQKGAADVRVETLSDADSAFVLDNARMIGDYDNAKEAARYAPTLRRRAAKYPDNAFAAQTLAMAEIRAGDFSNADKTLAKLEALAPNDVTTPYLQALRFIEDGRARPAEREALWKQARGFAARAFRINENHYPSLYLYSVATLGQEPAPTTNTMNALLRAYELAPNVEEFRLESVIALLRTGKKSEAKQLLLPLAYAPHSKGGAKFARKLLERMDGGEEITQALGDFECCAVDTTAANKKKN